MDNFKVEKIKIQGSDGNFYEYDSEGSGNYGLPVKVDKKEDYVYELYYNEFDYTTAKENIDAGYKSSGSCFAVYRDKILARNFDWSLNKEVECVVKIEDSVSYFGSVSICGGLSDMDREFFERDAVSKNTLKLLPFYARDGINSKGLVAAVLTVPRLGNTGATPELKVKNEINATCLVRFILDNFATANEAVDYIKKYVKINFSDKLLAMNYELHWMIADENDCFWLEIINNAVVYGTFEAGQENILSNFHYSNVNWKHSALPGRNYRVFTPEDQAAGKAHATLGIDEYGQGLERYNNWIEYISTNTISTQDEFLDALEAVYFSKTYKAPEPGMGRHYSEYCAESTGLTVDTASDNFLTIYNTNKALYENLGTDEARREDGTLWSSLHSCSYDIENKNFKVRFNEGTEVSQYFAPFLDIPRIGGAEIDDTEVLTDKTWSSSKIKEYNDEKISDSEVLTDKTWSSYKISKIIDDTKGAGDYDNTWSADKIANIIDDNQATLENTWSSDKISKIIDDSQATDVNTWSSSKISSIIDDTKGAGDTENTWSADKISKIVDDSSTGVDHTWSSEKINNELTLKGTIPAGGLAGQVLVKASDDDRDVMWVNASSDSQSILDRIAELEARIVALENK